jgi:hypothetical protein
MAILSIGYIIISSIFIIYYILLILKKIPNNLVVYNDSTDVFGTFKTSIRSIILNLLIILMVTLLHYKSDFIFEFFELNFFLIVIIFYIIILFRINMIFRSGTFFEMAFIGFGSIIQILYFFIVFYCAQFFGW